MDGNNMSKRMKSEAVTLVDDKQSEDKPATMAGRREITTTLWKSKKDKTVLEDKHGNTLTVTIQAPFGENLETEVALLGKQVAMWLMNRPRVIDIQARLKHWLLNLDGKINEAGIKKLQGVVDMVTWKVPSEPETDEVKLNKMLSSVRGNEKFELEITMLVTVLGVSEEQAREIHAKQKKANAA